MQADSVGTINSLKERENETQISGPNHKSGKWGKPILELKSVRCSLTVPHYLRS